MSGRPCRLPNSVDEHEWGLSQDTQTFCARLHRRGYTISWTLGHESYSLHLNVWLTSGRNLLCLFTGSAKRKGPFDSIGLWCKQTQGRISWSHIQYWDQDVVIFLQMWMVIDRGFCHSHPLILVGVKKYRTSHYYL